MRSACSTSTGSKNEFCHDSEQPGVVHNERCERGPGAPCHRGRDWNVGGYALRCALETTAVASVTAIGRRKVGISHAKLKEVLHQEFADCSALAETLSGQDAAVFCLGTYAGAVSDAELRTITVDYTIEFARVFRSSSPCAAFSFSSGNGTDPTGRSRLAFARYKGEAEKALLAAGFPRVSIFRPEYIYPRGAAEGTEFQLPACARDLPRVLGAVPEPDDSGRQLGRSHGRCRCPRSRRAPKPGCREP
jgi:hypothetical protein